MHGRCSGLVLFALSLSGTSLLLSACVSETAIVGAPCPCPKGYLCCATLSACVAASEDCPDRYPPSSGTPCELDEDCAQGEICPSWCLEDGAITGPRTCARVCGASFPCAEGESCELTLHNGQKLEAVAVDHACVTQEQQAACGASGCSSCDEEQIGQVFCNGETLTGCFLALDPQCGLGCEQVALQDCTPGSCELIGQTPSCSNIFNGELCLERDCKSCGESLPPGSSRCEGDQIVSCTLAFYPGDSCDRICVRRVTACPAGETCQQEEAGPRCVPAQ